MATRVCGDWLTAYLEYVEDTEPPFQYHLWTGLSVLASTLQRKVWLKQGHENIYPNMFIVLVGSSGRCRKGTAIGIGAYLLGEIKEVVLSAESVTREALIKRMKDSTSTLSDPDNPSVIKTHCSITIVSEELSVFLRQNDINFLSNLTNWYDSRDRWVYETKGSGKDTLEGLCVNLLGGTAPDWLQSMLPQEAVGGGFTSRIIFVTEEKKRKTVTVPKMSSELKKKLVTDLEQIVQLKGQFEFSPEATEMYKNWYEEQDIKMGRNQPPINDPRFTGYCERRPMHLKKLCMVVSASHTNDKFITASDFERALEILLAAEKNMPNTFGGLGTSDYGQITEKVLRYIIARGSTTKAELMRLFYRDMDPQTLGIVEQTLTEMKIIKVTIQPEKGDTLYVLDRDMLSKL